MITARMTWVSFVRLLLVALLIIVAVMHWQHLTGMNYLHVIARILPPDGTRGC